MKTAAAFTKLCEKADEFSLLQYSFSYCDVIYENMVLQVSQQLFKKSNMKNYDQVEK